MQTTTDSAATAAEIIATERAALECWNRGDIAGLLEIYADDVSFFDQSLRGVSMGTERLPNISTRCTQEKSIFHGSRCSIRK